MMSGGLHQDGTLPRQVIDRVDTVIKSAKIGDQVIFSSSFTLNKLPVISNGKVISEASIAAQYFLSKRNDLDYYLEQQSHDTVGSLFFSFEYINKLDLDKNIKVVTSDFHLPRVTLIANDINKFYGYNVQFIGKRYHSEHVEDRLVGELESTLLYKKMFLDVKSKKEFFRRLVTMHNNYNLDFGSKIEKSTSLY